MQDSNWLNSKFPFQNSAGSRFIAGIGLEITDRKKMESALQVQRAKFCALFEHSPDAVFLITPDGSIEAVNPAACAMFGYSEQELSTIGLCGMLDSNDPRLSAGLKERQQAGYIKTVELTAIRKGAERFPVEVDSVILPGELARSFVIMRDITERKRVEEDLRQAEEKSRMLVEYAPSMIYEVDFRGSRFLNVNDTTCKTMGYSREELLKINPLDLLVGESKELFKERVARFKAGETPSNEVEYRGRTKDGRIIYGTLQSSFTFEDGQPVGAVVVAHDITARKMAEEKLQGFNKELEMMVAERTALAERRTKQLQALAIELIETEERERRQFAHLLHEDIQQLLAAANMQVQVAASHLSSDPVLSNVANILNESIAKSRRLSQNLSPPILYQAGLIAALEWLARQVKEQFGLDGRIGVEHGLVDGAHNAEGVSFPRGAGAFVQHCQACRRQKCQNRSEQLKGFNHRHCLRSGPRL